VDAAPQVLKVNYAYYRGVFSWRPVLISIGLLILGNLAGLWMISGECAGFVRSNATARGPEHAEREGPSRRAARGDQTGQSTYDDVAAAVRAAGRGASRVAAAERRTSFTRDAPPAGAPLSVGWLTAVRHWDIERYEVEIELDASASRTSSSTCAARARARPD